MSVHPFASDELDALWAAVSGPATARGSIA